MTTLHTINQSPKSGLLSECIALASKGDGIIFIEDGVYYSSRLETLNVDSAAIEYFYLKEDLDARGLELKDTGSVSIVNYRKFVTLCEKFDKIVSWF